MLRNHKELLARVAVFILTLSATCLAYANPQGGVVTSGSASISSSGNTTTINQSSQQAIVNWNSFNIAAGEKTQFNQPSKGVALNRINPNMGASQIYGTLSANGTVILINAAGIHFGAGSMVNVGSLIASTSDISNRNFHHGNYIFDRPSTRAGSIINEGNITTADYGLAALLGTSVVNSGIIRAHLGSIALGAGSKFTLSFTGDDMINFTVNGAASSVGVDSNGNKLKSGVSNTGKLIANGGQVLVTANMAAGVIDNVIDMSGIAEARSVRQHAGEIILSGGSGGVYVSGGLIASGRHHNRGGLIEVLGKNIEIASSGVIDATGATGGGNVYIGGDEHGTGSLEDAITTTVDGGAMIDASATHTGNGGTVIVWSDVLTDYAGMIDAKGGSESGNGGFTEVSGKQQLDFDGSVNLTAVQGAMGTLLLDPENVTIQATGTSSNPISGGVFTPTTSNSILTVADLQAALATANVNVTTGSTGTDMGNITVNSPVTWSSTNTLTLTAANNIYINASITAANGGLTLSAVNNTASITSGTQASPNAAGVTAAISVANFTLSQGEFFQNAATVGALPTFTVTNNFVISGNGSFNGYNGTFQRTVATSGIVDIFGLQGIATLPMNNSYTLGNSFDASVTSHWTSSNGTGFSSIGLGTNYSGTFNGGSFTISNLLINLPSATNVGLFSSASGNISNLTLSNVNVTGGNTVGALVGSNSGTVSYDSVSGQVTQDSDGGNNNVGGLVGYLSGNISYSSSSASVNGSAPGNGEDALGGLAGNSVGNITYSFATGSVNSSGGESIIIGGLVGINQGGISNSYASGNINGSGIIYSAGGLMGEMSSGTVTNTYSIGSVSGYGEDDFVGGFVGATYGGTVTNSYFDNATSGQGYPVGQGYGGSISVATENTAGMMSVNFGTGWSNMSGAYPYLTAFYSQTPYAVSGSGVGGSVTLADNGSIVGATQSFADGSYYFLESQSAITSGSDLLIYATTGTANDVTLAPATSGGSVTGANLIANTLQIGSNGTSTMSNTDLSTALGALTGSAFLYSISGNNLSVSSGALSTTSTTTFTVGGNITTSGAQTYNGALTINNNSILNSTNNNISFSGAINDFASNTHTLNINAGTGTVTLSAAVGGSKPLSSLTVTGSTISVANATTSGAQSYTGATTLNGNYVTSAGTFGITGTDNIAGVTTIDTTNSGGSLGANISFSSTIDDSNAAGTDALILNAGTGTVSLSGVVGGGKALASLNVTGATTIGGNVSTSAGQTYNSGVTISSAATFTGGNINFSSTLNGSSSGKNLTINTTGTSAVSGIIGSNIGTFSVDTVSTATGTLTLSGADTYTGATAITYGTLTLGTGGSLPTATTITLGNTTGAELNVNGKSQTIAGLTGGGTTGGVVALGNGTLTVNNTSAETFAGVISGTGGSLILGGSNTLSGANTYTGTTTINSGILTLGTGGSLSSSTIVSLANTAGAEFNLNGISQTVAGLTGGGATGGTVVLGSAILTVDNTSAETFSGVISGTGSLTLGGSNTLTLGAANTYTGATTINSGTLTLGAAGSLSSSTTISLANTAGAEFNVNGRSQAVAGLTGGGTTGGVVALGNGTLTVNNTSAETFAGVISGTGGSLTLGGSNTLSGANTYTGTTTINSGILTLGTGGSLSSATIISLANTAGAEFNLNGISQTVAGLTGGGSTGGTVVLGSATLTVNNTSAETFSGVISGTGSLTLGGSNTLTLGAANTYTGATTINSGILTLGTGGSLSTATIVSLANAAGAELNLNNHSQTIAGLTGGGLLGGNVALGSGTLTINNSAAESYSGVISGSGSLIEAGSNVLTLSALNTFSGSTTIQSGTLNLTNANALADSSSITISGTLAVSNVAANLHAISMDGGTLSGTGTSSVNGGAVTLAASTSNIISTASGSDTFTVAENINGAGDLQIQGAGKVVLGAAVGNTTKLSSVTSTAGTTGINSNVATTGNQTYNGAVVLGNGNITFSVANDSSAIAINQGVSGNGDLILSGSASGSNAFTLAGTLALSSIVVNGGSGGNNVLTVQSSNAQTWNIASNNTGTISGANSGSFTFNNTQNLVGGSVSNDFVFANNALVSSVNGTGSNNTLDNSASVANVTDTITANNTGTTAINNTTMNFSNIQNLIGTGSSTLAVSANKSNEIVLTGLDSGYVNDPTNFTGFTTFSNSGSGSTVVNFASTPDAIFDSPNTAYYINANLTFNGITTFTGNFIPFAPEVAPQEITEAPILSFGYIPNVINSNGSNTSSSVIPAPTSTSTEETTIVIEGDETVDGSMITVQYLAPEPTYPGKPNKKVLALNTRG